jgi:hypothetical protein
VSLLIAKRVVVHEKPSIAAVFSQSALLELERNAGCQRRASGVCQAPDIVWMKEPFSKAWRRYVFHRESAVVEGRAIEVQRPTGWIFDQYGLRNGVNNFAETAVVPTVFLLLARGNLNVPL